MGCDIHMYAETRRQPGDPWEVVGAMFTNDLYPEYDDAKRVARVYTRRNYETFTELAEVRDYGHTSPILGAPRGVPSDSPWAALPDPRYPGMFLDFGDYSLGEHSFSNCSLAGLKMFYRRWSDDRFRQAIDELVALKYPGMSDADVRVVFGFDS